MEKEVNPVFMVQPLNFNPCWLRHQKTSDSILVTIRISSALQCIGWWKTGEKSLSLLSVFSMLRLLSLLKRHKLTYFPQQSDEASAVIISCCTQNSWSLPCQQIEEAELQNPTFWLSRPRSFPSYNIAFQTTWLKNFTHKNIKHLSTNEWQDSFVKPSLLSHQQ